MAEGLTFPNAFGQLDEADRLAVIKGIMAGSGEAGMHEDEIERQANIVADWIVKTIVQGTLLDMVRSGSVRATADAAGTIQYTRQEVAA